MLPVPGMSHYSKRMKHPFPAQTAATLAAIIAIALAPSLFIACANPKRDKIDQTAQRANGAKPLRIASMAPSLTAILVELGEGNRLVAVDSWSGDEEGVPDSALRMDMMNPDAERIAELAPDLLLASSITREGTGKDPFRALSDAGIRVVYVPTSDSVAGIRGDIERIASLVGREDKGREAIARMDEKIAEITRVAGTIPQSEKKTAFFEISPAPWIYSFGKGVYLDDVLTLAGASNVLSDEKGWIAVSAEAVATRDPDVIITNQAGPGDPVAEILARPGWSGMKAVRDRRVYRVDNRASSQPGPGVALAIAEIAKAVYPEYFK